MKLLTPMLGSLHDTYTPWRMALSDGMLGYINTVVGIRQHDNSVQYGIVSDVMLTVDGSPISITVRPNPGDTDGEVIVPWVAIRILQILTNHDEQAPLPLSAWIDLTE